MRYVAASVALCVTLMMGGCTVFGVVNAFVPRGTYAFVGDIVYGDDPRQRLDLYLPANDAVRPAAGYPVVVFFYGGSWTTGNRADYRFVGESLASRGIVTVLADYRLYPQVRYPEFLRDSAAAVAWTAAHVGEYAGDRTRLLVMGHSAGGYNAAMLALDPRWLGAVGLSPDDLAGWIGLAGPYDFLPSDLPDVQRVFHAPDYPPGAQPIDHVSTLAPPALLATGDDDRVVSAARSTRQLADRLRAAGVPVTARFYPYVGHGALVGALAAPLRWMAPVRDDVIAFVRDTPPRHR